ncbi:uncharacterized protein DUF397 [Actinocorallia herbida]|uniref:Uncharacterized protein DUF397 n=1 Tax=Actinocorallia herbida TaxID=58109 RepID=A0A3N1CNL7_9ACTN|nr:DUF397 domain-containing protein [Actinocorallia herbida]ROO82909.1 uncharacterized protein DUF397 [Actinocorallia herbida]
MSPRHNVPTATWRKSSHSAPQGSNCVELADLRGRVGIRDSKNSDVAHLTVTRRQFSRLASHIRAGSPFEQHAS